MSAWTPVTTLPKQTLTQSGLIAIDSSDNEVQLITRSNMELRSLSPDLLPKPASASASATSAEMDRDINLIVTLTTHRIVFQFQSAIGADTGTAHFLHHCALHPLPHGIQTSGGNWTSNRSYKIHIASLTHGNFNLIFRKGQKDRDSFYEAFHKSLTRRQWEETYRQSQTQTQPRHPRASGTSDSTNNSSHGNKVNKKVGIDAILQRNQHRHERAKNLTNQAFGENKKDKDAKAQEVEVLFREAKELTGIIHKYVATLEKNQKEDTTELTGMLNEMGIITALTKESTEDKSFHELLARQICDFLSMNKAFQIHLGGSGIMTLTDVYCL
jgi:ESCRT-II complex subunit VPS36